MTLAQKQDLSRILWSWDICADCGTGTVCEPAICSWHRSENLQRFFQHYQERTCLYSHNVKKPEQPGLSSHEDLFDIIRRLKLSPDITRETFAKNLFMEWPLRSDQERAIDLAVRVMFMINSSTSRLDPVLFETGSVSCQWRNDITLTNFVENLFTKKQHPNISRVEGHLRAVDLKNSASLDFESTDNMKDHLSIDHKRGVVKIFHHAAFLKEQLRLTFKLPDLSTSESLKM